MSMFWLRTAHGFAAVVCALGSLSVAYPALFAELPLWAKISSIACGAFTAGWLQTAPQDRTTVRAARLSEPRLATPPPPP